MANTPQSVRDPELVRWCADKAARAVTDLWDRTRQTFWRSTEHRSRESESDQVLFFPTVTVRCANALLSFVGDAPDWARDWEADPARAGILKDALTSVVSRDPSVLHSTLDIGEQRNAFTLSIYVDTLSQICQFRALTSTAAEGAADRLQLAAQSLARHPSFEPNKGNQILIHPFILYHAARALRACEPHLRGPELKAEVKQRATELASSVREAVKTLLAKYQLGALAPGESVALAFCAGTLMCPGSSEDLPYVLTSLKVCLESQDLSGSWPLGRVVRENKDVTSDKLEISTFEIAAVIADIVHTLFSLPPGEIAPDSFDIFCDNLVTTATYAKRSMVHMPMMTEPRTGWCTDHAYGSELIESWTSATVLLLMLSLRRLFEEHRRRAILKSFVTISPNDRDWPPWLRWSNYSHSSEVDHDFPILRYLDDRLIKPILQDPRREPPTEPRSVSVLLFGPPGTAKTTLVKAVADGLGWPMIILSPGTFIERGLEYIEAQAKGVFDQLLELSRAVVLFDECDELFRERKPLANTEQTRGITAFVTASMLPKLQDLHDRGRVVFFICTNNFESMDSAVKRGGRIDHIIGVGPPDRQARDKILNVWLEQQQRKAKWSMEPPNLPAALNELAALSERFTRTELIRAAELLFLPNGWSDDQQARRAAKSIIERLEPGLTITDIDLKKYREQRKQFSRPVIEGG